MQKNCIKQKKTILLYVALVMLFCAVFSITFAWLGSLFSDEEEISFTTGTIEPLKAHMWMYTTDKEDISAGWVHYYMNGDGCAVTNTVDSDDAIQFAPSSKENEIMLIPSVTEAEDGTSYKYEVKSLHMGTIDNLAKIEDDNVLYFCFEINAAENGKHVTLDITQPADYLQIFSGTKYDCSSTQINDVKTLNTQNALLEYQYAIATTMLSPGGAGFESLDFDGSVWSSNGINSYHLEKDVVASGTYYVYIRVIPNLKTFGRMATILYNTMPCQILMDWDWEINVH